MNNENLNNLASPISIGLLNAASAFLLDEQYYLDYHDTSKQGLIDLIEKLKKLNKENINIGGLNLLFRSHDKNCPLSLKKTIEVILPTFNYFISQVLNIINNLISLTHERNNIIYKRIEPLKINEANIYECITFKENLLNILYDLLSIYKNIKRELINLEEFIKEQEYIINYAFFILRKYSHNTILYNQILDIYNDYNKAFEIIKEISLFIERLNKRIEEIRNIIIPQTKEIVIELNDE